MMPLGRRLKVNTECAKSMGIDLRNCRFLGQGHSGKVYLLPDGKVIKIFKNEESCIREYMILQSARSSRNFPRVYGCRGNCMIREYVRGVCLQDYLKKHKLSRRLAVNLINLIEEFKRIGFSKLDMRCAHIFVQPDESVMVIDPRKHYTEVVSYPRTMLNEFKKLHTIIRFMNILREERPDLYNKWNTAI